MERNDGKVIAIIALFVGVIGLSIGFAALQSELTINGSARVQTSNWDVHFENLKNVIESREGLEIDAPTIDAKTTTISGFNVVFKSPGDSVSYEFDVANDGSYGAEITTLTVPTPTCTGSGDNKATDETNVCSNLTYTLTYKDSGSAVAIGDELANGATKTMVLTLTYKSSVTASQLPKEDVTISTLEIPIVYSQQ